MDSSSASSTRRLSTRAHILLIVFAGAIAPLTLIGAWLTSNAVRSGKDLLREQLTASAGAITTSIEQRWVFRKGELLLLADNVAARDAVSSPPAMTAADSAYLAGLCARLSGTIASVSYRDATGEERWTSLNLPSELVPPASPARQAAPRSTLLIVLPTHDADGRTIGQLEARVALGGLLPADSTRVAVPRGVIAIRDRSSKAILTPSVPALPFDRNEETRIGDSTWIVVHDTIQEPRLELALGAPTTAYVRPFEHAARVGFVALLLVASIATVLSIVLTTRLTQPLQRLVEASAAVARGDLERRVEPGGPPEVEALSRSFNAMTESLQRTMAELSRRSALAAVGEFAASMAHEVRNALTSLKVDLQRAEERLPTDASSRMLVARSLEAVTHLDSTVTGALRVARSGTVSPKCLELEPVIAAAAERAAPTFAARSARLVVDQSEHAPHQVNGDAAALEQLFLNLFLNAAQALPSDGGGQARVSAVAENGHVIVKVADNGDGIAEDDVAHVLRPFFTTRSGGTGLGLSISRQIAVAHGGDLTIESALAVGTIVSVRLPRGASAGA